MKIDPLPRTNYLEQCPWCFEKIRWDSEDQREETNCPSCGKPIVITRSYYDDSIIISAERSDTDRRYMKLMGIEED